MKAELVPSNGDQPIPITNDVTVVGRREFCDVQIHFHGLSKRHCILVKTDGLLVARDLATTNGTKVNGQRIRWAALLPNDKLEMGGYKMKVYLGSDDVPSPSERTGRGAAPAPTFAGAIPRPAVRPAAPAAPSRPARPNGPPKGKPAAGFPAPSPLVAPLVNAAALDRTERLTPEELDDLVDLDRVPVLPTQPPGRDAVDGDEFVIDLD
jgi:hypothetical protein